MKTSNISKTFISRIYKPMRPHSHKGTQGHALLIGGSYGKIGSITLAALAALRSGCGLVTAFIPECGYTILQTAVPEVMVITDSNYRLLSNIGYNIEPDAIGIGPGIGQDQEVQEAFLHFLQSVNTPLVVDADAINILSANPHWISLLPLNTILTPHPKELERLIGAFDNDDKTISAAMQFAAINNCIIIIKGAPTKITDGKNLYQNTTGNAALATAGSGDTLTGIVTGLLAQGYNSLEAAQLGVYLHGLTADIAATETGAESFIASDILNWLGKAFLQLK